jgi:hypothetical protein
MGKRSTSLPAFRQGSARVYNETNLQQYSLITTLIKCHMRRGNERAARLRVRERGRLGVCKPSAGLRRLEVSGWSVKANEGRRSSAKAVEG